MLPWSFAPSSKVAYRDKMCGTNAPTDFARKYSDSKKNRDAEFSQSCISTYLLLVTYRKSFDFLDLGCHFGNAVTTLNLS